LGHGRKQLRFADHSSRKRTARYFRWAFPDRSASDVFRGGISILFKPLALGSYWAVPVFALIIPVIVLRILNEETILRKELAGYDAYCLRTHSRLIPYVW
jgi:protein-S-isoprenylcysteine O-methyltransferase Ste14